MIWSRLIYSILPVPCPGSGGTATHLRSALIAASQTCTAIGTVGVADEATRNQIAL